MAKNLLACRIASYKKFQDAAWSHLPELAVQHIEINVPASDAEAKELNRKLQDSGMKVSSFQGRLDLQAGNAAEQLEPQLNRCKEFGVSRLFLSVRRNDMPADQAYGLLREAGDLAASFGVTLLLETHPDLVTNGDVAKETMVGVNHPNVRINFDTANIYYYNDGRDAVTELRKVLNWVEGVHLKDSLGAKGEFNFPPLGQGIVDFPSVVRMLNERGFFGPFTMELEGKSGEEPTLEGVKQQVVESVNYLRSTGLF